MHVRHKSNKINNKIQVPKPQHDWLYQVRHNQKWMKQH